MNSNEELKNLLQELKTKRLTDRFCKNEDKTYEGNWDATHLSQILSGKRKGNLHYNRMLTIDIKAFLKKIK